MEKNPIKLNKNKEQITTTIKYNKIRENWKNFKTKSFNKLFFFFCEKKI